MTEILGDSAAGGQFGAEMKLTGFEQIIITGNKRSLIKDYTQRRARATHTNPRRGPFFPRFPDRILRRTVRGMLPWKTTSGRLAYRRLSAYINIPDKIAEKDFGTLPDATGKSLKAYMTVGELAKEIGWTHEERTN